MIYQQSRFHCVFLILTAVSLLLNIIMPPSSSSYPIIESQEYSFYFKYLLQNNARTIRETEVQELFKRGVEVKDDLQYLSEKDIDSISGLKAIQKGKL